MVCQPLWSAGPEFCGLSPPAGDVGWVLIGRDVSPLDVRILGDLVHPVGHELLVLPSSGYQVERHRAIEPSVHSSDWKVTECFSDVSQQVGCHVGGYQL